jgi:hypothetical protein
MVRGASKEISKKLKKIELKNEKMLFCPAWSFVDLA